MCLHMQTKCSCLPCAVNGEAEHVDLMDSSVTEDEMRMDRPTAGLPTPPLVSDSHVSHCLVAQHVALCVTLEQGSY